MTSDKDQDIYFNHVDSKKSLECNNRLVKTRMNTKGKGTIKKSV